MKNASASGFSNNQMLPSLLPLPASFFKVLPLPQKFNRFHRIMTSHLPQRGVLTQTPIPWLRHWSGHSKLIPRLHVQV